MAETFNISPIQLYITLFLIVALIICYAALKILQNKHKTDPNYQKRMAERQREEQRKNEEDMELESYFSNTSDFDDDE